MSAMQHLFTYGTLSLQEVMQAVTGREFATEPATLADHRCRLIEGMWFPGIAPQEGESVRGLLHRDLDEAAFAALDDFESSLYERLPVTVHTETGPVEAQTYVLAPHNVGMLSKHEWNEHAFRADKLSQYLKGAQP